MQAWERGKMTTSKPACDKLMNLLQQVNDTIENALDLWEEKQLPVTLIAYNDEDYKKYVFGMGKNLPNSVHKAMIYRLFIELLNIGADANIVLFNPESYQIWLSDKGQTDTQELRAAWGAWYKENIAFKNDKPGVKDAEAKALMHTPEELLDYVYTHEFKNKDKLLNILKLKMRGLNFTQIAEILKCSRQYVNDVYHNLDKKAP